MVLTNKIKLKKIISEYKVLIALFSLACIVVSIQPMVSGTSVHDKLGLSYNHYNNYTIFKYSYIHLTEGKDLYTMHIEDHFDLYKYTPTFSVFFGLYAMFPDWLGLYLWNLTNALVLLGAIYYLPKIGSYQKGLILLILTIELITSLQNGQSNALMAALAVWAFGLMERRKYLMATLLITFSIFIKLFGIVGFALFLLYPKKWKLAGYSIFWTIALAALPLLFISIPNYMDQVYSYIDMLGFDHSESYGYSVMGWLYSWFSIEINKYQIVGLGVAIFLIPMIKISNYRYYSFRLLLLISILIWVVIFNHKAESPTFIIAMTGVGIWYIISDKNILVHILFWSAFIFTSLSPTDLFPAIIRNQIVIPYVLKGFPCILIWMKVIYDMIVLDKEFEAISNSN